MPQEQINTIIKSLEGLAECDNSEIKSIFTSALSAAKASASRAQIPNTRLGNLARYSVAASAASTLRAYLASNTRTDIRDTFMRAALRAAFDLVVPTEPESRQEEPPAGEPPEGWQKSGHGSYTLDTAHGQAELVYSPHMPGGDWTLNLKGVPIGFGTAPDTASAMLDRVIAFLASSSTPRRHPFRARRIA
jgi:hypothetical protein